MRMFVKICAIVDPKSIPFSDNLTTKTMLDRHLVRSLYFSMHLAALATVLGVSVAFSMAGPVIQICVFWGRGHASERGFAF